jgi:hypothetical protein
VTDELYTTVYEVGDRLLYIDTVTGDPNNDLPMAALERQAEVVDTDEEGMIYIEYADGVSDWLYPEQVEDLFERVTWATTT